MFERRDIAVIHKSDEEGEKGET